MKKQNLLLLSLMALLSIACDPAGDEPCCVDMSVATRILYKNSKSENLLTIPNGINAANVKLYYVTNGVAKYYNNAMMDDPTGVRQVKDQNGDDVLNVVMNSVKEDFPITLIQLSETDTDTIKTEYNRANGSVICTKIWYNGVVKWDNSKTGQTFVVVKN